MITIHFVDSETMPNLPLMDSKQQSIESKTGISRFLSSSPILRPYYVRPEEIGSVPGACSINPVTSSYPPMSLVC